MPLFQCHPSVEYTEYLLHLAVIFQARLSYMACPFRCWAFCLSVFFFCSILIFYTLTLFTQIVTQQFASNSGSSDEEPGEETIHVDASRLEETVQQLKEVLGEEIPIEELRRLARAADYDVNRAINFFFNV